MNKITNKGFTLVEVLIAVGVLTAASLAFLPSFAGSLGEKKLQQSADAIRDATATARNRALTEVGSPGAVNKYKYAGVKFVDKSGTYFQFRSVEANKTVCNSVVGNSTGDIVTDSTRSLPDGLVARLNTNETPLCIFFTFKTAEAVVTKGTGSDAAVSCTN